MIVNCFTLYRQYLTHVTTVFLSNFVMFFINCKFNYLSVMGPGGGMIGGNNLLGLMLLGGGEMLPMDDLMSMMMMRRMFSGDMGSTGPTTNTQG